MENEDADGHFVIGFLVITFDFEKIFFFFFSFLVCDINEDGEAACTGGLKYHMRIE